jgi:hypothetical protein
MKQTTLLASFGRWSSFRRVDYAYGSVWELLLGRHFYLAWGRHHVSFSYWRRVR